MKKIKSTHAFFLTLIFIGTASEAHWHRWHEADDDDAVYCSSYSNEELISSKIVRFYKCEDQGLRFARVQSGNLMVDAWVGGYVREQDVAYKYQVTFYPCAGTPSSKIITRVETEQVEYPIENPNVSLEPQESFLANAPMTDEEAKMAHKKAFQDCQKHLDRSISE